MASVEQNVKLLDGGLIRLMFGHGAQALGYSSMPMLPVLLVYYGASEEVGWVMAAGSAGGLLSPDSGLGSRRLGKGPDIDGRDHRSRLCDDVYGAHRGC